METVLRLRKNDVLNISKNDKLCNEKSMSVGINWDGDADMDLMCFAFKNGKLDASGVCFYDQPHIYGISHTGDVKTSSGMAELFKEEIELDMDKIKNKYNRILFLVTIYEEDSNITKERRTKFGNIVMTAGLTSFTEKTLIAQSPISENYPSEYGIKLLEIYLEDGDFKYRILNQAEEKDFADYLTEHGIPFKR